MIVEHVRRKPSRDMKVKVTGLLWNKGLMEKASNGKYEISVQMS